MHNFFVCLALVILFSCQENKQDNSPKIKQLTKEEKMQISQNSLKKAVLKEQEQIIDYIHRNGHPFKKLPSGVHYLITDSLPHARKAQSGELVKVKYKLSLLNGKLIFKDKEEQIVVDYENKESGFFEALKMIGKGEKAYVIIPSYRAHGLAGNDAEIPPLSTLVYQIYISDIQ